MSISQHSCWGSRHRVQTLCRSHADGGYRVKLLNVSKRKSPVAEDQTSPGSRPRVHKKWNFQGAKTKICRQNEKRPVCSICTGYNKLETYNYKN